MHPGGVGSVVLQDRRGKWLSFQRPVEVITAECAADVLPGLREIEMLVLQRRLHAAGFISYEAAPGLDDCLVVRRSDGIPLLWFGLFEDVSIAERLPAPSREETWCDWQPTVARAEYRRALGTIRERLAAGSTYQVNFTFRARAAFDDDPWQYFLHLADRARAGCAAYVDTGRWCVCSASPELFFDLRGDRFVSRPMKGTAPRGAEPAADRAAARALRGSPKERAENLMIVDMIRNDVGRVAEVGSVTVPRLWTVERYPTVLQMTSTVRARVPAPPSEVLRALFPCASVTGAPKASTMAIIAETESSPRGLYTGSIGMIVPDAAGCAARFNVAIRTVVVDRELRNAEYGVGGGILYESDPEQEYRECEVKMRVLLPADVPDLMEALLWTPREGYYLLERHLERLSGSAAHFQMPLDREAIRERLTGLAESLPPRPHKVRIVAGPRREPEVTAQSLDEIPRPAVQRICLATNPVRASDPLLRYKTARRATFEKERADHPRHDDVILWNERGEVTESCSANVVVETGGEKLTPPVSCGLLPGTFRAQLLADGEVRERVIRVEDFPSADAVWLVNSVRKWMRVELRDE